MRDRIQERFGGGRSGQRQTFDYSLSDMEPSSDSKDGGGGGDSNVTRMIARHARMQSIYDSSGLTRLKTDSGPAARGPFS